MLFQNCDEVSKYSKWRTTQICTELSRLSEVRTNEAMSKERNKYVKLTNKIKELPTDYLTYKILSIRFFLKHYQLGYFSQNCFSLMFSSYNQGTAVSFKLGTRLGNITY
jgi:hypothetical protein